MLAAALTRTVEIVNAADVIPDGTTTLCCIAASVESEASITSAPLDGAAEPRTTVPVTLVPPSTDGWSIVSDTSAAVDGAMVRVADLAPRYVAVMVAACVADGDVV